MKKDIAIIGGGIGGVLAAITAAKLGQHVVLTEETAWIGGQLTSQAVPPDEHPWIETFGCTKTYRTFRNEVRDYYKRNYPMKEDVRRNDRLNPGNGWVSRIAHEPRVSLAILYDFLQPYISNGQVEILLQHKPVRAEVVGDEVRHIVVVDTMTQDERLIEAEIFLDATELGDVLPLARVDYVVGAESRADTDETNALAETNPQDIQSFTHVMALDYLEGGDFTIEKPAMYDFWRNYQASFLDHIQLSEYIPDAHTGQSKKMPIFTKGGSFGMWEYRRIIDKAQYTDGFFVGDVSLINWPQNDYWLGSIIDVSEADKQKHLAEARQLSLSLLYWLQTEAPHSGGKGYPGFRLRPDVVGTKDGLAMHPYIRESRRIKAMYTVTENDINADLRGNSGVVQHENSVGVGAYRIDLHPTTAHNRLFYAKSYPFEIPLGSLIPVKVKNLLPACKNIGTTQLTNGCFRVHPVEWNIGESAGALAAFSLKNGVKPLQVYGDPKLTSAFQDILVELGVSLHWPEVHAF